MRKYVDPRGGLTVDKSDTKTNKMNSQTNHIMSQSEPVTVSASDMIDTMYSYLSPSLNTTGVSSGNGECVICGKKTAYDNRKICVDCFKRYKDQIVDGLKTAAKDVEFKIS